MDEGRKYIKTGSCIMISDPGMVKVLSDTYQRNMRESILGKGKVFILDMLSL